MPANTANTYIAGRFILELAGQVVGDVTSLEGGSAVGQVAGTDQGTPPVQRKTLGGVDYEPIVFEAGVGMAAEFWNWIADTLHNQQPRRDGRIIFLDYQQRPRASLSWSDGLLTEILFPELDASAKDAARMRLTIEAETTTYSASSFGATVPATHEKAMKSWSPSNFRLTLSGMNVAPPATSWIGPIKVKQPYVAPPTPGGGGPTPAATSLEVSDLSVAVSEQKAGELYDWHRSFVIQGQTGDQYERTGRIEYLNHSLSQTLFGLDLKGLGIRRVAAERRTAGASALARVRAEMYMEEVDLVKPAATTQTTTTGATGGTGTTDSGTTGGDTGARSGSTGIGAELVELLREVVSGGEIRMVRSQSSLDTLGVADRLIRSTEARDGKVAREVLGNQRVAEGRRIGVEWARQVAALSELEEIAAVADSDWNAIKLAGEHSLVHELRAAGVIAADQEGDIFLERDPFVEALVDGASEVYAEVRPVLHDRGVRPQ